MRDLIRNHSFLRDFYESRLPYTEEFEQMHDTITEEVGKFDNIFDIGWAFNSLKRCHQAIAQAPDAIYRKNVQVYQPQQPPQSSPSILDGLTTEQLAVHKALPGSARRTMTTDLRASRTKEMREGIRAYNARQQYETVDMTWQDQAEHLKCTIIGALLMDHRTRQPLMSKEQARAIQERLLNEIPVEGFLEIPKTCFAYNTKYMKELNPGDPLLVFRQI